MEEVKITNKDIKIHLKKLLKELNKDEKKPKKQIITGIKINCLHTSCILDLSD